MASIVRHILVVDDDSEISRQINEYLSGEIISEDGDVLEVTISDRFSRAIEIIDKHRFDLIVLDIREEKRDEEAGIKVLKLIKEKWFIPVVFYSGLSHTVKHMESNVVKVLNKDAGIDKLLELIKVIFQSGIPQVNRSLVDHVEAVKRSYMWDFAEKEWSRFKNVPDRYELAYLLARRISLSFANFGIKELAESLPEILENGLYESEYGDYTAYQVSPMHYYIVPPMEENTLTGDIYLGILSERNGYWMVLTPSCDFWQNKIDKITLAECNPLCEESDYLRWSKKCNDPNLTGNFKQYLGNGKGDRTFFLPSFLDHPNLIVDYQKLKCCSIEEFNVLTRIASLDSTFANEAISKFIRHYARRGIPNLNKDIILRQLVSLIDDKQVAVAIETK